MDTLFLGLSVPANVADALVPIYNYYGTVLEQRVPKENLHVTLAWLGSLDVTPAQIKQLCEPLPQSFVPTVRITHVGRGRMRYQLWAFVEATGPIVAVRDQLMQRLEALQWELPKKALKGPFAPHIKIGTLFEQMSHVGVADHPFIVSYAMPEIVLYKSTAGPQNERRYQPLGSMALV